MRHLNGAKFESAPDQSRAKTAMVGDCSTFAFATETTVEELKNCSKNQNTAKSIGFWLSFWKNWCVGKEITDEIENYEPAGLNTLLEHFDAEVNNTKKVKIMNQKAHLKNKGCTLSIVRDREFSSSKEVLEEKAKQLRLAGRGKRPNKARQVSEEEEEILWMSGKLEVITQNLYFKHIEQFHELFSPFLQLANFKNIEQNVVLTARVMIIAAFE